MQMPYSREEIMRTSAVGWLKTIVELAKAHHLNITSLFAEAGLNADCLSQPQYRFPQDSISQLWLLLAEKTHNPAIGLAFGQYVNVATFGALGYVFLSAASVKEALESGLKYQHYLGEGLACRLEKVGESYHFCVQHLGDKRVVTRQTLDAILSSFVSLATWIFRQPIVINEVILGYGNERDVSIYQQFFACPVRINKSDTRLILPSSWVESPLPSADPMMFEQQQKWLQSILNNQQQALSLEVKKRIKSLLPTGTMNKEQIASSLFLTAKTLQRRLTDEGSQFQQLVDESRQELACELLQQTHVELLEIAELVGYHDYSTFAKAFKHWTGQTPKVWREQAS